MPLIYGNDKKGKYVKWGNNGARYHYSSSTSRTKALNKAKTQGRAIEASKHSRK